MEVTIVLYYGVEMGVGGHVISVVCWEPFAKNGPLLLVFFVLGILWADLFSSFLLLV